MLDRMVAVDDRGLLVPFIGVGMSYPGCRLLNRFVAKLEQQAGIKKPSAILIWCTEPRGRCRSSGSARGRASLGCGAAAFIADRAEYRDDADPGECGCPCGGANSPWPSALCCATTATAMGAGSASGFAA